MAAGAEEEEVILSEDEDIITDEEESVDDAEVEDDEEDSVEDEGDEEYVPSTALLMQAARLLPEASVDDLSIFGSDRALEAHLRFAKEATARKQASDETESISAPKSSLHELKWMEMPDLNAEDMEGEDIIKTMTGMNDHNKKVFETVTGHIDALGKMLTQSQIASDENMFESAVNGLNEEWTSILGRGDISDIDEAQFANRKRLISAAYRLRESDTSGKPMSWRKLVEQASGIEFQDHFKKIARKEIATKASKRGKVQRTVSGKKRPVAEEYSDERATAEIEAGLQKVRANLRSA